MPNRAKEATYRWRKKYPERYNAYMRKWRKDNPEKQRIISKKARSKVKGLEATRRIRRRWHLKANFGLSLEAYENKLQAQNGVCAICSQKELSIRRGTIKSLDVDHDHITGKIRGLLCSACNASLGLLKEDPKRLESMIKYLEFWQNQ